MHNCFCFLLFKFICTFGYFTGPNLCSIHVGSRVFRAPLKVVFWSPETIWPLRNSINTLTLHLTLTGTTPVCTALICISYLHSCSGRPPTAPASYMGSHAWGTKPLTTFKYTAIINNSSSVAWGRKLSRKYLLPQAKSSWLPCNFCKIVWKHEGETEGG